MKEKNSKEKKKGITVLGSVHMDFITETEKMPRTGETVTDGKFHMSPGGKGMNQAIAAARMDAKVNIISKIGDDEFGEILEERIKEEKIDIRCLFRDEEVSTSTATIILDSEGNNRIIVDSEADKNITPEEIRNCREKIESSRTLLSQLELPERTVKKTFKIASYAGLTTVLNFAPAEDVSPELMKNVDFLILNEIELNDLIEKEERSFDSTMEKAKHLLQRGPEAVIVTLGKEGSIYARKKSTEKVPAFDIKVKDTTGAGDAFCAGFTKGITYGKSLKESVLIGNAAGALSTTEVGAQKGLPNWSEVMDLVRKNRDIK